MKFALDPITGKLYDARQYVRLPESKRPSRLVCPGQDDDGKRCLVKVNPAATRPGAHQSPHWRANENTNRHILHCDHGARVIDRQMEDKARLIQKRKQAPRGNEIKISFALANSTDSRPSKKRLTKLTHDPDANRTGTRNVIDTNKTPSIERVTSLRSLLEHLIAGENINHMTPVTTSGKYKLNTTFQKVVRHAKSVSKADQQSIKIIYGRINSVNKGTYGMYFINFDQCPVGINLRTHIYDQLDKRTRKNLAENRFVIAIGKIHPTRGKGYNNFLLEVTDPSCIATYDISEKR